MIYDAEQRNITFAVAGDAMITKRMSSFKEEGFLKLVQILRQADASFANAEMLFHRWEAGINFQAKDSISYQVSDPVNIQEMKWMGFKALSTATNHAYDYSEAGFVKTLENMEKLDMPQAGGGRDLDHARAPAYLDTNAGRVALMAACSTYSEQSPARPGRHDFPGKPGINALRHSISYQVPRKALDTLKEIKAGVGLAEREKAARAFQPQVSHPAETDTEVGFLGSRFLSGDKYNVTTKCNKEDLEGIGNWIRGASKQADWLAYAIHCHENGNTGEYHGGHRISPPDFLIEFAHYTIDRGCHLFFSHGPHALRGIEIYKGKPIFYSLGNFIFQNEAVQWVPEAGYSGQGLDHHATPGDWGDARSGGTKFGFAADLVHYRSAVCVSTFSGGNLKEVRIYPIDLGFGKPIAQRGRPVLAEGEVAQWVLNRLQEASKPFGTKITIEGNTGVIRL